MGKVLVNILFRRGMCTNEVRVRFAPSPTGQLHIGGYRTALYNYLFAKKNGGKFILRLEDTDQERFIPGAAELMEQTLKWGQIESDESPLKGGKFGPYTQSQRLKFYQEAVEKLLENGSAYRCFCTERRLELLRKEAARNRTVNKYDGKCRNLTQAEIDEKLAQKIPYTIRFNLENAEKSIHFQDLIYGPTSYEISEGDPIILKSDGFPTYHLANVVDDHFMQISHVFRGFEWQISTSKHILLYAALGWKPPKFGHLPLIINSDGTKLSKRQGDIHVEHYKEQGYYSETILNFALTAGGGFTGQENQMKICDMNQLIEEFDIGLVKTSFSQLDFDKLNLLNRKVLERRSLEKLLEEAKIHLNQVFGEEISIPEGSLIQLLKSSRLDKISDLTQSPEFDFVWRRPQIVKSDFVLAPEIVKILQEHKEFTEANPKLKKLAKSKKIAYSEVMKFIRISLSGHAQGPPIKEMFEFLGREEFMTRLKSVI